MKFVVLPIFFPFVSSDGQKERVGNELGLVAFTCYELDRKISSYFCYHLLIFPLS